MVYLKTDGSLDIDHINRLPIEERMVVIGNLTSAQYDYYVSTFPINEGNQHTEAVCVDYGFDDNRSGIDIDEYLKKWKNETDNK